MPRSKDKGRAGVPPAPSFDSYVLFTRADANPDLARWENEGGACLPRGLHAQVASQPSITAHSCCREPALAAQRRAMDQRAPRSSDGMVILREATSSFRKHCACSSTHAPDSVVSCALKSR